MAYSKTKLKRNGVKTSPCFKPFFLGNISYKCLHIRPSKETLKLQSGESTSRSEQEVFQLQVTEFHGTPSVKMVNVLLVDIYSGSL